MGQLVMPRDTACPREQGLGDTRRLVAAEFERLYRGVYRYLVHRFFDADLAEDLTAETFFRLSAALGSFQGQARQLEVWLFRTATNLANTHLRRMRVRRLILGRWADQQPKPPAAAQPGGQNHELQQVVRTALAGMPAKHQTVIVLRYYSQMPFEEIAAVLECEPAAARKRLSRALRLLEHRLARAGAADRSDGP